MVAGLHDHSGLEDEAHWCVSRRLDVLASMLPPVAEGRGALGGVQPCGTGCAASQVAWHQRCSDQAHYRDEQLRGWVTGGSVRLCGVAAEWVSPTLWSRS